MIKLPCHLSAHLTLRRVQRGVAALASFAVVATQSTVAQIPNPGFESWTAGYVSNWLTNTILPSYPFITPTTTAHSGTYAAQASVLNFGGFGSMPVFISGQGGKGFPVNFRPAALHGFYTFTPVGGDYVSISVSINKAGVGIGAGNPTVLPGASTYTEFVVDLWYVNSDIPDTATISFMTLNNGGPVHVGTTYTVDDLSWGSASSVERTAANVPAAFFLEQNYPNPFNPTTSVKFGLPHTSHVTLKVFNALGQEVATVLDRTLEAGEQRATIDASRLATGVYYYTLRADGYTETKKMVVVK